MDGCGMPKNAELDLWLGWISLLLNPHSGRKDEVWIPNLGGRFLIKGKSCLQRCGHNVFKLAASGRTTEIFMKVAGSEGSSFWARLGSHKSVYYTALMKKILAGDCI